MLGVVKVVPVPRLVPPVKAENQLLVPAQLFESTTVPGPQRFPGIVVGAAGIALIVAIAGSLVLTQALTVQST